MLCSGLICWSTILVVMPFDNIKTYLQQYNLEVVGNKKIENPKETLNIRQAVKRIYDKGGFIGFFTGWRAKLMCYLINFNLTIVILEYTDQFARKAFQ